MGNTYNYLLHILHIHFIDQKKKEKRIYKHFPLRASNGAPSHKRFDGVVTMPPVAELVATNANNYIAGWLANVA